MSSCTEVVPVKTCTRCAESKFATREYFSPLRSGVFGLNAWCKSCCAAWRREDRKKDPERYKRIQRKCHETHREKRLEYSRKNWNKNKERYREGNRLRQQERRDQYNANRRAARARNPERSRARQKEWRERNRDKVKILRQEYWRNSSPQKRLRSYFGAAISHSLAGRTKGGAGWQDILGYTISDLVRHIERQFEKGMSWENYGDWHVDHRLPVSSFQFTSVNDSEFHACWALTNLRPIWAKENITKRDKRILLI